MEEEPVVPSSNLYNKSGKMPGLESSTLFFLVYLILSLQWLVANLTDLAFHWSNHTGNFVQIVISAVINLYLLAFLFLFISGILVGSGVPRPYFRHSKLRMYGFAIIVGAVVYPLFTVFFLPFVLLAFLIKAITGLGNSAFVDIYLYGIDLVWLLLINVPIIAIGMLFSKRKWQTNLLVLSIILSVLVVALNFSLPALFPPIVFFLSSLGGALTYKPIQLEPQYIIEIAAYLCIAAVFIRGNIDMSKRKKVYNSRVSTK